MIRAAGMAAAAAAALAASAAGCGGDDAPAEVCVVADGTGPVGPTSGPLCTRLSSYRMFADLPGQVPAAGVQVFDLNTPLFTDYADKLRLLWVPDGQSVTWADLDSFDLPVGTVIAKTFSFPFDRRDRALGRLLVETRILVHQDAGWKAGAYVYDADAAEATLAVAGDFVDVSWIHDDGTTYTDHYAVPNVNQCGNCHGEHDEVVAPLGPKARHLNRIEPGGTANQLQAMIDRGWLVGAPADPDTWPRAPVFDDDQSGTLDERARAWLDINCSHCHNPRGAARTSGLDLSITQTDPVQFGVCKPPVAAGPGSGGRRYSIVPGAPDESIMVFRLESVEPQIRMPELGRNLVHAESVALIRDWITAMPGTCPTP